jgi:3',5'-cyclic AMP phosphodiesterase CpdA
MSDGSSGRGGRTLFAISDLHVGHADNRPILQHLWPSTGADWLVVAGDVAETLIDIEGALATLRDRFEVVIWAPGNHELWSHPADPSELRGAERYDHLVEICRRLDVLTPEDPYPCWDGPGGPALIAPLFLLYDYSFRAPGSTQVEALAQAHEAGVICTDEYFLHPDPYPTREAWCHARVDATEKRLADCPPDLPLVLVSHWPLVRQPTSVLRYPDFAQWCGTARTADWHRRFNVVAAVYGHLHIPRSTVYDGVPFEEVSLGYPREWRARGGPPEELLRPILPRPTRPGAS